VIGESEWECIRLPTTCRDSTHNILCGRTEY